MARRPPRLPMHRQAASCCCCWAITCSCRSAPPSGAGRPTSSRWPDRAAGSDPRSSHFSTPSPPTAGAPATLTSRSGAVARCHAAATLRPLCQVLLPLCCLPSHASAEVPTGGWAGGRGDRCCLWLGRSNRVRPTHQLADNTCHPTSSLGSSGGRRIRQSSSPADTATFAHLTGAALHWGSQSHRCALAMTAPAGVSQAHLTMYETRVALEQLQEGPPAELHVLRPPGAAGAGRAPSTVLPSCTTQEGQHCPLAPALSPCSSPWPCTVLPLLLSNRNAHQSEIDALVHGF